MPTNQDTLIRQWHMLRLVPRHPKKATVQSIRSSLLSEGFDVTDRTVQRDLNELSTVFPLVVDDREKPFGWSWQKDAPNFNLPGLSIPEALTLALAEQQLNSILPTSMLSQLKPYFTAAHQRLDVEPQPSRGRSWLNKVRRVEAAQPLLPAKILAEVQAIISEALLLERQVEINYRNKGSGRSSTFRIHPLGLVQRGAMLYLYCRISDYENACTLAMSRISQATLLDEPCVYPKNFSLDESVEAGVWGFSDGNRIAVDLLFEAGYGDHLMETPLEKAQQIQALEDGRLKVAATVADAPQLRWWLLGFGSGVEVLGPAGLRKEMTEIATELFQKYSAGK